MSSNTGQKKNVIVWQDSYSVKINLIDEQHLYLVKLTNQLFTECLNGREESKAAFRKTIRELVAYVHLHFSTEEKVMERINYPDLKNHKKEHREFVEELFIKMKDFTAGNLVTPINMVYFLRDWIMNHIAVCDKKYGNYVAELNKSGELQKIASKSKSPVATNTATTQ
ncbi:MAG: bacteriohemerythrin [Treponema sp.]|nr:bacteriohemerythrin [Treponema sp.]